MGGRGTVTSRFGTSARTLRRRRAAARASGGGGGAGAGGVDEAARQAAIADFLGDVDFVEPPSQTRLRERINNRRDPTAYFTGKAPGDGVAARNMDKVVKALSGGETSSQTAETIFKVLGYDRMPEAVSLRDVRRDIQAGAPRLLRAISGGDEAQVSEFAEQLIRGATPRVSGGMHGTGIAYTASGADARKLVEGFVRRRNARGLSNSADLRMTLKKTAKVVNEPELRRMLSQETASIREMEQMLRIRSASTTNLASLQRDREALDLRRRIRNDMGLFAAVRGYDAIHVPSSVVGGTYGEESGREYRASEFLILNRGAVRVSSSYRVRFGATPAELRTNTSLAAMNKESRRAARRRRATNN